MSTYTTTAQTSASITPTVDDLRTGLRAILGDTFDAAWTQICTNAHTPPNAHTLSDTQFDELLTAIAQHNSLTRVLAMSWRIRRTAARKLAELGR